MNTNNLDLNMRHAKRYCIKFRSQAEQKHSWYLDAGYNTRLEVLPTSSIKQL